MDSLVRYPFAWFRRQLLTRRKLWMVGGGLIGAVCLLLLLTLELRHPSPSVMGVAVPSAQMSPQSRVASALQLSSYTANDVGPGTPSEKNEAEQGEGHGEMHFPLDQPIMARSAELSVTAKDFLGARSSFEQTLARHKGYAADLKVEGEGTSRVLTASLRVPVQEFQGALQDLKQLGVVVNETQAAEEVTQPYMDLTARLKNGHETEARLTDILLHRTGKMSEVLEAEQQVSRVRGEIEQMQAELRTMEHRVSFATIALTIQEQYTAQFVATRPGVSTQLRNAFVNGLQSAFETIIAMLVLLAGFAPALIFWAAILFFPARWVWKRTRAARLRMTARSAAV